MNDDLMWRDNMPLDQKVAVLYERTGTYMRNTSHQLAELKTMLETALHIHGAVERQGDWQGQHDIHHGEDDFAIGRRLSHADSPVGLLIKRNQDAIDRLSHEVFDQDGTSKVKMLVQAHRDSQTAKGVYLSIWKVIAFVITLPASGAIIGWLGNQAGWW